MRQKITFSNPEDVSPNDLHCSVIRFPFMVRAFRDGVDRDILSEHNIDVEITPSLQAIWELRSDKPSLQNKALIKILFEYACREIKNRINIHRLDKYIKIDLHVGNSPTSNDLDPEKIQEPDGYSFEIEQKNPIGF